MSRKVRVRGEWYRDGRGLGIIGGLGVVRCLDLGVKI